MEDYTLNIKQLSIDVLRSKNVELTTESRSSRTVH